MSRSSVAFPRSYQRHLVTEQRKAVLAALRDRIGPEHTVGEVLDAAEALGWSEPMGDLSLADLAAALLTPLGADDEVAAEAAAHADDTADEAEADDLDDDDTAAEAPVRGRKKASAVEPARGKAGKKKTARAPAAKPAKPAKPKAKAKAKAEPPRKKTKKPPSKAPAVAKKTGKSRRAAKVDFDEPMSLEEAAGVLVPLVRSLGEATMQDLEEQTAGGRRKLRFHIGQLVRHGYLHRHGMGRGTFYTVG